MISDGTPLDGSYFTMGNNGVPIGYHRFQWDPIVSYGFPFENHGFPFAIFVRAV